MLFSEGYISYMLRQHTEVPRVEPQYGYINPPQLEQHDHQHSFEDLIEEYREINEIYHYYSRSELFNNSILDSVDVSQLLSDTFNEENYASLLTKFNINLRPSIYDGKVPIDNLM